MHNIFVGTSGWHYPHWRGRFYPEALPRRRWLEYYTSRLSTVELNGSFYKLPSEQTIARWAAQSPPGFLFSVKAWRVITHRKKLEGCAAAVSLFSSLVSGLGAHLGPILFQLPPRFGLRLGRLEALLEQLPPRRRYAFELRDPSWHTPELLRLLERHNAAFCVYELAGLRSAAPLTADFVYVRLHGPGGSAYTGRYREQALRAWAEQLLRWREGGRAAYLYFDNDQAGHAAQNALRLQQLLTETAPSFVLPLSSEAGEARG